MREIAIKTFIQTFWEGCNHNRRFCYVLGAGASKESGIPTGVELTGAWQEELREAYTKKETEELAEELGIDEIGDDYFDNYDLRFYPDERNGYAFIENILRDATPSYGYYPLAMQLAHTRNNLLITTNFDSMAEDALFVYTDKRPLVTGPEHLADAINMNADRPIIAKVRRGVSDDPLVRKRETGELIAVWKDVLRTVFQFYTPVVIGYGGGDRMLTEILGDPTLKTQGFYWCYLKNDPPSDEIRRLTESKKGRLVPVDGFDRTMFHIAEKFGYDNPTERINEAAKSRSETYERVYAKFAKTARAAKADAPPPPPKAEAQPVAAENERKEEATDGQSASEKKSDDGAAHLRAADERREAGDIEGALDFYAKAAKADPDNADVYQSRGRLYDELGRFEQAIADYTTVTELNPASADAYNDRGSLYDSVGEYEKAVADYTMAMRLKSGDAAIYANRGYTYDNMGQYDKAIADYGKAIEMDPNYAWAYNNRGFTYDNLKEYDRAIADYTEAIRLDPEYEGAYNNRGSAYFEVGRYAEAVTDCTRAIELNPDNAEAYRWLGEAHLQLGNADASLDALNKATELNPDYEKAYRARARLYEAVGDAERAAADTAAADAIKAARE